MTPTDILNRINSSDLVKRLITEFFDEMILVDCATERVLNATETMLGRPVRGRDFDGLRYDEQVRLTMQAQQLESEYASPWEALCLATVRDQLERHERYCVKLCFPVSGSDEIVYKELTYIYLDERRDILVMLCQDVTNIVTGAIDPLTGLYTISEFHKRVRQWIQDNPGRRYRMQRYNIDRFRDINGIFGYRVGNRLLKDFGGYMRRFDSKDSFAAHLNADHFVRFCAEDSCTVQQCYGNFADSFSNYALQMPIKLHMGVYDLCEPDCDSFTMSYKALLALQSIKGNLTRQVAYYEKGMMAEEAESQELLSEVQDAIRDGQFEVWFQPQLSFADHRMIGAEALVRWRHPKRGMVSPATFIPMLEKSDCIGMVDRYVFEKVCSCIRTWSESKAAVVPISVNLSRNDVYKGNICDKLLEIMEQHRVNPQSVRLEITESAYIENTAFLSETLAQLHQAGFRVEMDDFGSGYSSLNILKDIPVDQLKLDMDFLKGSYDSPKGRAIVSAVIHMAKTLGLTVIAEGVETREQAEMLAEFGCDQMQGYYFSKPIGEAEFAQLLQAKPAS